MTVDELIARHLDAAYNLARWLVTDAREAEDVVQDACVRAIAAFGQYRGGDARAWLLAIVRNGCRDWHRRRRQLAFREPFDEVKHHDARPVASPEDQVLTADLRGRLNAAIGALPDVLREVVILREIEDLSYREIAEVIDAPIGTVMSRLSRARARLVEALGRAEGGAA